jgi:hypothetical protein
MAFTKEEKNDWVDHDMSRPEASSKVVSEGVGCLKTEEITNQP